MRFLVHLVSLLACLRISVSDITDLDRKWQSACPGLYPFEYKGYAPRGNLTSGTFHEMPQYTTVKHCTASCCRRPTCNIILMHNNTCYHISCISDKLCTPLYRPDKADSFNSPSMVLVKPVDNDGSWADWVNDNDEAT